MRCIARCWHRWDRSRPRCRFRPAGSHSNTPASGLDACGVAVISLGGLDCYAINPRGKRIDRNDSCELLADGATLQILETSGIGTHLAWQVTATDADGNSVTADCEIEVVRARGRPDK